MYYILSLKWSSGKGHYVWWRPNDNGYTTDINEAGLYTKEKIESNKPYYSNFNTMPVPQEFLDGAVKQTVIPTLDQNFKSIGIHEHLKTAVEY